MIEVKHDHKLQFPTIAVPMIVEDEANAPVSSEIKQTNIEGIMAPLFRFNDHTINFSMVDSMILTCSPVPRIHLVVRDDTNMIKDLDKPGVDNVLYIQILPPSDDTYKKIQMAFYITHSSIDTPFITLDGVYFIPGLFDTKMEAYGRITTYDLFEKISNEYSLGFCSNVAGTDDERWIYNPNRNLQDFLYDEIRFAGKDGHVYDWWIDFWNNLTLVDLYTEYNTIVEEKDLQIWVDTTIPTYDDADEEKPGKMVAAFCNHPMLSTNPLFISDYTPVSSSMGVTDKNFEVYSTQDLELRSTLIQDGDVHNNITVGYEYGGELYGDFDYLSQRAARNMFLEKISSERIKVSVGMPLLSLIKGGKVNIWWYDINSYMTSSANDEGVESNITIPHEESGNDVEDYKINRTISGQYYIMDIEIRYEGGWRCTYTLSRSAESIQRINPPSNETFMS